MAAADLPLLAVWLREPQVARWWNHEHTSEAVERDFGASVWGEEPGQDLIVSLDGHFPSGCCSARLSATIRRSSQSSRRSSTCRTAPKSWTT